MSTLNYLTRTLKSIRTKRNNLPPPTNELVHPRFGINETDKKTEKKDPNSLLFLMYSKENETLFI
ncbi:hypothetical protein ACHRVK_02920 [Flavobacterium plurextorum]|uniref:Uncharacterized protein n=2 Tax=Flavobacterium TaxID=237 RepID=A0A226IAG3_9FLAO|nr:MULTISPECIES: hypothetical protein [Flavobacterium]OXB02971.1 hypothetical protein B0A75_01775 [Flavobacterium oncorhynchi]OXB09014.1 hypothetical protein B0A81_07585 [Flavobacterium plurextorum]PIF69311.1 hypothetical protein CLU99_0014 [Flavobacterium sp. 2]RXM45867.1 hypothetical protein BOW57_04570 [Flavobacterium sp. YO64]UUW10585.1 hypothetical protein NLG42_07175 [Flavobacterium plurextorum]